ncbi:MAG: VCBS repeat-containing protein [Planctomycetes bacterium]|nr:VCBS repeat-containing protein [Planctomycetota bacterium]
MNSRLDCIVLAAACLAAAVPVTGQTPLMEITAVGSQYFMTADLGDIDGDGVPDLIVSDDAGETYVYSGVDSSVIHVFPSTVIRTSAAAAGDVNGDGTGDVIVGYHTTASAVVHSGADGSQIHALSGTAGSRFGFAVDGAGDVNGDGFSDVIVGSAFDATNVMAHGSRVRVISGLTGGILHEYTASASAGYGRDVGGVGDVNGDGCDEFFFFSEAIPGTLHVHSGMTGANLYMVGNGGDFGVTASRTGDMNDDGVEDLCAYVPGNPFIEVLSGTDGSPIW